MVAALALATVAAGVPSWGASAPAAAPEPCARPQQVPVVGAACRTSSGMWEVTLPDGYQFQTHGADYVKGHLGAVSITPKKPACVTNPSKEFHTRVIYAHPSDESSRYSTRLGQIRGMLAEANGFIRQSAASQSRRMDLRVYCVSGDVSVAKVRLPTTLETSSFDAIIQALRNAGYSSTLAKYWVWLEGKPRWAPGGIGTLAVDDRASADNKNNNGPSYNVTFGLEQHQGGAAVMLHEGSHNFGGVQGQSAPYGSGPPNGRGGGMHCNDGRDIMCYPDGGSLSNYSTRYCSAPRYDCRNNTYFNTRPSSSSYLAKHWNLGSPLNRWFSGCTYKTGMLTAGTAGHTGSALAEADQPDPLRNVSYSWVSVSSSCDNRKFALSGVVAPSGEADRTYGQTVPYFPGEIPCVVANGTFCQGAVWTTLTRAPVPDMDVCFYRGSKQLRCYAAGEAEQGTVPNGTTKARITLAAGANAIYVLNVV